MLSELLLDCKLIPADKKSYSCKPDNRWDAAVPGCGSLLLCSGWAGSTARIARLKSLSSENL